MLRDNQHNTVGLDAEDVLEVFQVLYQSGGCIEAFHKHRGTRRLLISAWKAGSRDVGYELTINAPAFVTNIVGTELIVNETQTVTWANYHGDSIADPFEAAFTPTASSSASDASIDSPVAYTIVSVPVIQSTGSDRFVTQLAFEFAQAPHSGKVYLSCSLQVEAKIWGLQSTLEPYMLSEANKQLSEFVPFISAYFREMNGTPMLSSLSVPGAEVQAIDAAATTIEGQQAAPCGVSTAGDLDSQGSRSSSEHFYDAVEEVPKGVRAAVQIFEAAKGEAASRKSFSGRLSRSSTAALRCSVSPIARPASIDTSAPATPPEPCELSSVRRTAGVPGLQEDHLKLRLECAALKLEAAERRYSKLSEAAETCLSTLQGRIGTHASWSLGGSFWGGGVGIGFIAGVVFGVGAAAALSWGGGRSTYAARGGR